LGDFDFIFRTCRSFNFARLLKFGRIRSSFSELRSLIVIGLRFTKFSMPPSGKTMRNECYTDILYHHAMFGHFGGARISHATMRVAKKFHVIVITGSMRKAHTLVFRLLRPSHGAL